VHFLCSTFGSAGDVFPMLGLALELRKRGHQITFATNAHFEETVRSYGLAFEALGTDEQFKASISHPDLWHPRRSFPLIISMLTPVFKQQYQLHADRASSDLIGITNVFGFGALNAQDKLKIPTLTLHLQPSVIWSDDAPPTLAGLFGPRWLQSLLYRIGERCVIDPAVCPYLNAWRKELGLSPVRAITRWWNSRYGVLAMFPEWYAPPQKDWPRPLMQTDFPLWNHQTSDRMPEEVERFLTAGDAPLVFTPGSANVHGQAFFEAAVEACRVLGRRGILLTGFPEQLPKSLPESILYVKYVPLDLLLPRAAAFVHHGGIGSASQAILAGIPQLLMPLAHDQFDNVTRVKKLNVGDGLPATKFTAVRLIEQLKRLLGSSEVALACRATSARMQERKGLRQAADAVEDRVLLGDKIP